VIGTVDDLVTRVLAGELRAVARLCRLIDDDHPWAPAAVKAIHPRCGKAHVIGITGNPGSGKSTLVDQLIVRYRARGLTVAVVAVDPSSPYSGGALLGDRIRMQQHALDEGVFVRSLATRGHLGGLSRSATALVHVFDAAGFDVVLVETVGVGQAEVEIVRTAHTSVVVLVPGLGDEVQVLKAGVMEIADIFGLNKADRVGHDRLRQEINALLALHHPEPDEWVPQMASTVATVGTGVDELLAAIDAHRAYLAEPGHERRLRVQQQRDEFWMLFTDLMRRRAEERFGGTGPDADLLAALDAGELDPLSAAEQAMMRLSGPATK
jgi:LAO/AO transport system kinase